MRASVGPPLPCVPWPQSPHARAENQSQAGRLSSGISFPLRGQGDGGGRRNGGVAAPRPGS
ncbi:hypothetical protein EYF80_062865 [Liparis tanakae]|uniref:Uncharacterized protein n=1 Tax=Liparis tanakae TaxID=230148 RepID=A0A4Z2EF98_9TELE|nr:hypothetical protein EYF80_062865 [Liparis tanakae]